MPRYARDYRSVRVSGDRASHIGVESFRSTIALRAHGDGFDNEARALPYGQRVSAMSTVIAAWPAFPAARARAIALPDDMRRNVTNGLEEW